MTEPASSASWLERLSPYLRPHRREFAICIGLSVLSQVPMGLLPLMQQIIVDDVIIGRRRALMPWLLALLGLGVVAFGLQRVSLRLAPGERLGIVGSSGSGKTTLALLMARFYDPTAGRVLFDGKDARSCTVESLRAQVGFVFEDSFLFSSSIRDNIALGKSGASQAEIEGAARAARAHDFISALPSGYDTRVGERGSLLSGGQRQRIGSRRCAWPRACWSWTGAGSWPRAPTPSCSSAVRSIASCSRGPSWNRAPPGRTRRTRPLR